MSALASLFEMLRRQNAQGNMRARLGASDPGGPIYLDKQVADPNDPHFLEFGDHRVQLVGEKPRPNMYYRDPMQGGPSPPGGDTFAQIVGKRR